MRAISIVVLLWFAAAVVGAKPEEKLSTIVCKVEAKDEEVVKNAIEKLRQVEGVKEVRFEDGTLTVRYHKPTVGCCSKIFKVLKESNVDYKVVKKEEFPPCKKGAKKSCGHHKS